MKSIDAITQVLKSGFVTQKDIQAITKLSQATVSRCLKKLDDSLLVLPFSSPNKYALPAEDKGYSVQFKEVDEQGNESKLGTVYRLANDQYFVDLAEGASKLYLGEKGNGLFDGLPFFLDDLRPQGFLGNLFVKQLADMSDRYPKKLSSWQAKHIFQYLEEYGDDLPGNLKFGVGTYHLPRQPVYPVPYDKYDFMCEQIKAGVSQESSLGGEQQKFTVFSSELNADVLVKYTSNKNDAVTRRWKDILVTEYHALKILAAFKIPAAEIDLIDRDNRFYLVVKRFDRIGFFGRSSMFSLLSIDMEYVGLGENWQNIANEMLKLNLLSKSDNNSISILWAFSQLIANTDTHLGNISLGIKGDSFNLLPIYDMCTMAIAPKPNSLDPIDFTLPDLDTLNINQDNKSLVLEMAFLFWQRIEKDTRISGEFRNYLKTHKPYKKLEFQS